MIEKFLVLILIGLFCPFGQTKADAVSDIKKTMTLYGLVQSTDGEPLIASDILDILTRLQDDYLVQKGGIIQDKELDTISSLIDASKVSEDKCNLKELTKISEQMKRFKENRFYLVSYLKHYWHDQFVLCKKWLLSALKNDIGSLTEEDQKDMSRLRGAMIQKSITKHLDDREGKLGFNLSIPALELSLSKIMKLNSKYTMTEYLYHYNGKTYFSQEFLRLIGKPCLRLSGMLKESEKAYTLFMANLDIMDEIGPFEVEWVGNIKMCRIILTNVESISTSVFNQFKSIYGSKDDQMRQIVGAMVPKLLSNDNESNRKKITQTYNESPAQNEGAPESRKKKVQPERRKHWYELEWGEQP